MLFFDYPACWHIWLWHHIRLWHIWQCLTTKFLIQITEYACWDNHTAAMSRHVNGLISYICSLDPSCCQNYKHKSSRCQNYSTLLWHWRDSVSESLYMLPCRSTKDCNYVISTIFRPNAEECSKAYTNEHQGFVDFPSTERYKFNQAKFLVWCRSLEEQFVPVCIQGQGHGLCSMRMQVYEGMMQLLWAAGAGTALFPVD